MSKLFSNVFEIKSKMTKYKKITSVSVTVASFTPCARTDGALVRPGHMTEQKDLK